MRQKVFNTSNDLRDTLQIQQNNSITNVPEILTSYLLEGTLDSAREFSNDNRSQMRQLKRSKTRSLSREDREDKYFERHLCTLLLDRTVECLMDSFVTQVA